MQRGGRAPASLGLALLLAWCGGAYAQPPPPPARHAAAVAGVPAPGMAGMPVAPRVGLSVPETIRESLLGDVYAEGRWRPLPFGTFLSEGWLEPWAAAPAGRDGRTPRHGWLGAFEGVFYRLWLTPFSYGNGLNKPFGGNGYGAGFAAFLPLSRRANLLLNVPYVASNGTEDPARGYRHDFGDLVVTPRFLLQEDEATTQTLNLEVRTPTGRPGTGGGTMALSPRYEFWTNPGGPWVVRGSAGLFVPLDRAATPIAPAVPTDPLEPVRSVNETSFTGGLAVGRYFRPHDVPFGDLVLYAASNLNVPLDGGSEGTSLGLGLGTRFHIGRDYYLLNYWEVPVTAPRPNEFTAQFALLKVF